MVNIITITKKKNIRFYFKFKKPEEMDEQMIFQEFLSKMNFKSLRQAVEIQSTAFNSSRYNPFSVSSDNSIQNIPVSLPDIDFYQYVPYKTQIDIHIDLKLAK